MNKKDALMKKLTLCSLLFTLLMVAVTFVSCRKHDPDVPAEDVVIGMMSSYVSGHSSSRAIINDLADFQTQGNFGVFGWKEATTPYSLLIFDNVEVDYDASATPVTWVYSPIRYWDKSAIKYYFGAYAPHVSSTSGSGIYASYDNTYSTAASNQQFTLNDIPNWQPLMSNPKALNQSVVDWDDDGTVDGKLFYTNVNDPTTYWVDIDNNATYDPNVDYVIVWQDVNTDGNNEGCVNNEIVKVLIDTDNNGTPDPGESWESLVWPSVTSYDLMTATSNGTTTDYHVDDTSVNVEERGVVELNFSHILAQLVIKVKTISAPNRTQFHITKLEIGVDQDGKRVPEGDDTSENKSSYTLVFGSNPPTPAGSFVTTGGTATLFDGAPFLSPLVSGDVEGSTICSHLVVPFTVSDFNNPSSAVSTCINLKITYTSTKDGVLFRDDTVDLPLMSSPTENLLTLEAGKRYTTTIVFNKGKVIDLLDVAVSQWKPGQSQDQFFYNW